MRSLITRCAAAMVMGGACGYFAAAAWPESPVRVELNAMKYAFSVKEIRVRKGVPVIVALTSADFAHGFSVPDFHVRADAVPGKTVEVTFTPDRAGRFPFLCDNFCGELHDRMTGLLVVME